MSRWAASLSLAQLEPLDGILPDNCQPRGRMSARLSATLEAAYLPSEIEVVPGDLTIPESLERPLDDVDSVFLVWTAGSEFVVPALERIAHKAQRIVFLSAPLKTARPFFQQPNPARNVAEKVERVMKNRAFNGHSFGRGCLQVTRCAGGPRKFGRVTSYAGRTWPLLRRRLTSVMSLRSRYVHCVRTVMWEQNTF